MNERQAILYLHVAAGFATLALGPVAMVVAWALPSALGTPIITWVNWRTNPPPSAARQRIGTSCNSLAATRFR